MMLDFLLYRHLSLDIFICLSSCFIDWSFLGVILLDCFFSFLVCYFHFCFIESSCYFSLFFAELSSSILIFILCCYASLNKSEESYSVWISSDRSGLFAKLICFLFEVWGEFEFEFSIDCLMLGLSIWLEDKESLGLI